MSKHHKTEKRMRRGVIGAGIAAISMTVTSAAFAASANPLLTAVNNFKSMLTPVLVVIIGVVAAVLVIPALLKLDFSRIITVILMSAFGIVLVTNADRISKVFTDIGNSAFR
jgi:hypothetical protein